MYLSINVWTVSITITIVTIWVAARIVSKYGGGDFNFAGAIIGMLATFFVVALWLGVIIAKVF